MDSNCWTAAAAGLTPGIALREGTVVLGETGRERRRVTIPVDGGAAGSVLLLSGLTREPRFVEYQPSDPEFIRVRTDGTYTRGYPGSLRVHGAAQVAVEGRTAWGDAGRLGVHPDAIVAFRVGGLARVIFSGGRHKGRGERILAWVPGTGGVDLADWHEDAPGHLRPEVIWPAVTCGAALVALLREHGYGSLIETYEARTRAATERV